MLEMLADSGWIVWLILAAVLIVRDPRAVAPSFAAHFGVPLEEAVRRMSDPRFVSPAGEPALVLAPPLADPVPFEVECHVIEGDGIDLAEGFTVLASAEGSRLVAGPRGVPPVSGERLETLDIRPVGGYAAPLRA